MHTIEKQENDNGWCVYFAQNGIKMDSSLIESDLTFDEAASLCSYLNGGLPPAKRILQIIAELEIASQSVDTV